MKDRNVQYPNRYRDKISKTVFDFDRMPGNVTEEGSYYNKVNVLPDSVCDLLGLDRDGAQPANAFRKVYSGRFYGRISALSGGSLIGADSTDDVRLNEYCRFTTLVYNDYGNLVKDMGQAYYTKLPVPEGAKRIRITADIYGARQSFGISSVDLYKNGVSLQNLSTFDSSTTIYKTAVVELAVTGAGTDYFQIMLRGKNDSEKPSDSKGLAGCSQIKLEVTA